MKELWKTSTHSIQLSKWSQSQGLLHLCGKIYVPDLADLCGQIVSLCHNTKIAGHCRRWKTLELVSCNYWWPQMSRYIGKYVSTCDMCLHTKALHQPPVGKLHPLLVLDTLWDVVSVKFITELPEANGKYCIMVVVDTVTTISAVISTRLYVGNIMVYPERCCQIWVCNLWQNL